MDRERTGHGVYGGGGAQRGRRGMTGRGIVLCGLLAAAVLGAGALGALYEHNHSPNHLANVATISMEHRDYKKAIDLLSEALGHQPTGAVGVRVRNMLAQAYIMNARESDARPLVVEALKMDPANKESRQLLMNTYSAPAQRLEFAALKPLTREAGTEILAADDAGKSGLAGLDATYKGTAPYELALADLEHVEADVLNALPDLRPGDKAATHTAAALADARAAVQADPKDMDAARQLAQFLYADKDYAAVCAVADQLVKDGVFNPDVTVLAAKATLADVAAEPAAAARNAAAEARLKAFLKDQPQNAPVLAELGELALERGDFAQAEKLANQALTAAPHDLQAALLLAYAQEQSGQPQEAIKTLNPLTNQASGVPQVWYLLGQANSDAGSYSDADDDLKKALAIQGDYVPARRALLLNDLKSGNSDAANLLAAKLTQDDRYFIPAWAVRADAQRKAGNRADATAALQDLANDPNLPPEARPELVHALLLNDDLPTAKALYGKMLMSAGAAGKTDPVLLRTAGMMETYQGKFTSARAALEKALQADPDDVELRVELAHLLARAGYRIDARQQLDAGAKSAKAARSVVALSALGEAYLDLDLPDQARGLAQAALEIDPSNQAAALVMAQANALTGTGSADTAGLSGPQAVRVIQLAVTHHNDELALRLARIAMQKEPGNNLFHLLAAQALAGMNQMDAAANELVAAAERAPLDTTIYDQMVRLFNTPELAGKGIQQAQRLALFNAPLASWAAGELSITLGNFDKAAGYFDSGLRGVTREMPPSVKQMLYTGEFDLAAAKGDQDGYLATADRVAQDTPYAVLARLEAADYLINRNQNALARAQLGKIDPSLYPPKVQAILAQRYGVAGDPQHGLAILQALPKAAAGDPGVMLLSATLDQQAGDSTQAVATAQKLVDSDPTNAAYLEQLAQVKSAAHDFVGAFATLKKMATLGPSAAFRASSLRVKLLASLGLVEPAMQELQTVAATTLEDDYTDALAVGQIWAQLGRADLARQTLDKIPSYAPQYIPAQLALADALADSGKVDDAMTLLKGVMAANPRVDAGQLNLSLFHMALLAGRPDEAMAIAGARRKGARANSTAQREWTILAATAARDGGKYDDAITLLQGVPDEPGEPSTAIDRTMLDLIRGHDKEAAALAAILPANQSDLKTFTASLLGQDKGTAADARGGPRSASQLLALLAATPPSGWAKDGTIAQQSGIAPADLQALVSTLQGETNAADLMRTMALAQRTLEMQWPAVTIRLCDGVLQAAPHAALANVLKCSALLQQKETKAADGVLAGLAQSAPDLPSVRMLRAQQMLEAHQYQDVVTQLQPLESSGSLTVRSYLAKAYERLGQLDQSIALTRQLRAAAPDQVAFANDLAYRLAIASPTDPKALSAAQEQIDWAIAHAPPTPALEDTAGLIALLQNHLEKAEGYLTAAIIPLRLSPEVHLHLGLTYMKLNHPELARLHLRNVAVLAGDDKDSPEVKQAAQALGEMVAESH